MAARPSPALQAAPSASLRRALTGSSCRVAQIGARSPVLPCLLASCSQPTPSSRCARPPARRRLLRQARPNAATCSISPGQDAAYGTCCASRARTARAHRRDVSANLPTCQSRPSSARHCASRLIEKPPAVARPRARSRARAQERGAATRALDLIASCQQRPLARAQLQSIFQHCSTQPASPPASFSTPLSSPAPPRHRCYCFLCSTFGRNRMAFKATSRELPSSFMPCPDPKRHVPRMIVICSCISLVLVANRAGARISIDDRLVRAREHRALATRFGHDVR